MMKHLFFICPVIASGLFMSGCASTAIEKRLENNFVYQCSKKLLDDVDKKITGDDVEKICSGAEKSEIAENARKGIATPAIFTATPSAVESPAPTAAPAAATAPAAAAPAAEKTVADSDEVKPEPAPKNNSI